MVATIRVNLDDFDRGLEDARRRFNSFSSSLNGIGSGLKDIAAPAVKGFQAVEGVGNKAADIVKKGLGGFTVASTAVAGFGAAAVKSGMQFDASMSEVSAISGAAGQEFQDLRDKALEMGAKTQFSASDAAKAMTYMGMAGWKAGDMISGIEGIMNLAAASGEDLALTSDIVTDALTAFGKSAGDSGHLADIMAAASSNANTNVAMLGESFKYVAPVAGALGYSMEDTSLALGLMANSGIKASSAGTSLRAALTNMASPTKQMAKVMDQYGISLTNSNGEMYSLGEVMIQLREKMGGLDEATQASAASTLFGKEAMSGMLAIINAAPEDFEKLTGAIYECDDAAAKMAATMIDNLQGDLTLLGSAFESLQIAISDALTPTLREFAQFGQKAMTGLLEGFQSGGVSGFMSALSGIVTDGVTLLAQKAPEFASVSLQFVAALADGILGARFEIFEAGNNILITLTNGISEWLSSHTTEMQEFGVEIIRLIFQGFLSAGEIISENIGQFIPLIANAFLIYHEALFTVGTDILGSIGKGLIENKEEIQHLASSTIESMVTALSENAPAIIEGGIALIEALAGALMENMPLILSTGAEIVGKLVEGITGSLPAFAVAILPILTHIGKIIDTVGKIKDAVKMVVDFVAGSNGITKIIGIGKTLMSGIQALFGLIMAHPVVAVVTAIIAAIVLLWTQCEEFRDFVGRMVEAIIGFFSGLYEGISSALAGIAEFIGGVFLTAWELVQGTWSSAVEFFTGIVQGIQTVFLVITKFFGGLFAAAWAAVQMAWESSVEFFAGVVEGIKGVFAPVAEILGGFFQAAWEAVQNTWSTAKEYFSAIAEAIRTAFEAATEFLTAAFKTALEAIRSAWASTKEFFFGIFNAIKDAATSAGKSVGNALKEAWAAVRNAWTGAISFFREILDSIVSVFSGIGSRFASIGRNIVDGIRDGIANAWTSFIGWLGRKVNGIVDAVKNMLGIHSPSRVFAGIGENMALGLAEGWDDQYSSIKRQIENGMNFSPVSVGVKTSGISVSPENRMPQMSAAGGNTFNFTFQSPKALDPVSAAREAKKAAQQITLGYV